MKKAEQKLMMLECELTQGEINDRARQVSALVEDYRKVEEKKKDAVKEWTEEMKDIRAAMNRLSIEANRGTEFRLVDVTHRPSFETRKMVTIRMDTGEIVEERPLTQDELQLTFPDFIEEEA